MERGGGKFFQLRDGLGSVGRPSSFDRLLQAQSARQINLERARAAEQARRQPVSLEDAVDRSRNERVRQGDSSEVAVPPLAKAILFLAITGSTTGVIACGGDGSADNPTNTGSNIEPSPSNTLVVTATPGETPEVTAVPTTELTPTLKKLADAQYVPTDYATLENAFNSAFDAHPDASEVFDEGNNQMTRERLQNNLNRCRDGSADVLSPDGGRVGQCSSLVTRSLVIYGAKGYEEFYQIAVNGSNYFLTEYPQFENEFTATLEGFAKDSPPSK